MNKKGFTLIEVLLAITILGFSSVFLFRGFFRSLSAIDHSQTRLALIGDINNRLSLEKISLLNDELSLPMQTYDTCSLANKNMEIQFKLSDIYKEGIIAGGSVLYQWQEGNKDIRITKDFIWETKINEEYTES